MSYKKAIKNMVYVFLGVFCIAKIFMTYNIVEPFSTILDLKFEYEGVDNKQINKFVEKTKGKMDIIFWEEKTNQFLGNIDGSRNIYGNVIIKRGNVKCLFHECEKLDDSDIKGCVISSEAAQKLFGNESVKGLSILYQEKEFIIRSVVEMNVPLIIINDVNNNEEYYNLSTSSYGGTIQEKIKTVETILNKTGKYLDYNLLNVILESMMLIMLSIFVFCFYSEIKKVPNKNTTEKTIELFMKIFLISIYIYMCINILLDIEWPIKWSNFKWWKEEGYRVIENIKYIYRIEKNSVIGKKVSYYIIFLFAYFVLAGTGLSVIINRENLK